MSFSFSHFHFPFHFTVFLWLEFPICFPTSLFSFLPILVFHFLLLFPFSFSHIFFCFLFYFLSPLPFHFYCPVSFPFLSFNFEYKKKKNNSLAGLYACQIHACTELHNICLILKIYIEACYGLPVLYSFLLCPQYGEYYMFSSINMQEKFAKSHADLLKQGGNKWALEIFEENPNISYSMRKNSNGTTHKAQPPMQSTSHKQGQKQAFMEYSLTRQLLCCLIQSQG